MLTVQVELNSVQVQPAPCQLDYYGDPKQLGDRAWQDATSRSNSMLRPLFCSQYQSCVHCKCGARSYKFDPVEDLSLQLPAKTSSLPDVLCPVTVQVWLSHGNMCMM